MNDKRLIVALLAALVVTSITVFGFARQPAGATSVERETHVQLFGPVQNEGSLQQVAPSVWVYPGAATSTSYKKFWFNRAWGSITWAALKIEWIPNSSTNSLRLVHADDGPNNVTEIVRVAGVNNSNPVAVSVDVTQAMQQLAAAGVPKNIGWQIKGDNATPLRVYQVHLEILST